MFIFSLGTDLLPHEIDKNIEKLKNIKYKKISNFIGMSLRQWSILKDQCRKNGIECKNYGRLLIKNLKEINQLRKICC